MKPINNKEFLHNIAQHIDLFNTIGGGISETYVDIKTYKKGAVVNVWAAGLHPENFKVVLHGNQLSVFSVLQRQENPEMVAPMFSRTLLLPPAVDLGRIEAVHQDGRLQIRLPYHESADQPKEIEIKQL